MCAFVEVQALKNSLLTNYYILTLLFGLNWGAVETQEFSIQLHKSNLS